MNAEDNSLNQAVFLYACTTTQATEAVGAVFEAWYLNSCNQLPSQTTDTFSSISVSPSVTNWGLGFDNTDSPQCNYNVYDAVIHFHSYPTTDTFARSHGMSIDSSLVAPWWPPYGSKQFLVSSSAFDYYYYAGAIGATQLSFGSHFVQESASGFCPSYCWYSQTYVNGVLISQGNVDRNDPLNANFNVNSLTLTWSYT